MERVTLREELRLIERSESEVSGAWKGAHLLLFFLAFVFGSFCTFCFHMLMYLFDEKCVLFPKLLSLTSLRHNIIYDFIPDEKGENTLPVDFLSTQFVEKSACYLPTYVPLVSGIFGLVWSTMFLMCSSGSRSLSGLQRPWRVIPPVLVFSLAMSCLCIYSSTVTHYGLRELCVKLGTVTGSPTCSYTVNAATLAYERQIRGVYQATRLTITSAWMHTACWIASTILAVVRILLAVDFRLVKIRAELIGDMDRMLERHEELLRTVMPSRYDDSRTTITSADVQYLKRENIDQLERFGQLMGDGSDILFISEQPYTTSEQALLPEERNKRDRIRAYENVKKEHRFIVTILYNLLDYIDYYVGLESTSSVSLTGSQVSSTDIVRAFGQQEISSKPHMHQPTLSVTNKEDDLLMKSIKLQILKRLNKHLYELPIHDSTDEDPTPGTSKKRSRMSFESELTLTSVMHTALLTEKSDSLTPVLKRETSTIKLDVLDTRDKEDTPKSNLKTATNIGVQTINSQKRTEKKQKVTIAHSKDELSEDRPDESGLPTSSDSRTDTKKDEQTQTNPKEKQD